MWTVPLSEFNPATGHKRSCASDADSLLNCTEHCASELYEMHVMVERVLEGWDRLSKGESPTTLILRRTRDKR